MLTLIGLVMVRVGLVLPVKRPLRYNSRDMALQPSTRGVRIPNHEWLLLEHLPPAGTDLTTITAQEPPARTLPRVPERHVIPSTPQPTAIPVRREVITYEVKPGDNVWLISQKFNISQDTLIWANDRLEMDPDLLSIGDELAILPVNGVWHTVKAGDTLDSIAKRYKVTPDAIVDYEPNGLKQSAALAPGQKLIVPGGEKPFEPRLVYTSAGAMTVNARPEAGRFIWPCSGAITQYYGQTHLGLDIGNRAGTPLYAADSGTVTLASWWGNLGNAVRINHGNGYTTIYGHMQRIYVSNGQSVKRGQQIGEMGSTGMSTGPHVHFMIYYYGGTVNPIRYLPSP